MPFDFFKRSTHGFFIRSTVDPSSRARGDKQVLTPFPVFISTNLASYFWNQAEDEWQPTSLFGFTIADATEWLYAADTLWATKMDGLLVAFGDQVVPDPTIKQFLFDEHQSDLETWIGNDPDTLTVNDITINDSSIFYSSGILYQAIIFRIFDSFGSLFVAEWDGSSDTGGWAEIDFSLDHFESAGSVNYSGFVTQLPLNINTQYSPYTYYYTGSGETLKLAAVIGTNPDFDLRTVVQEVPSSSPIINTDSENISNIKRTGKFINAGQGFFWTLDTDGIIYINTSPVVTPSGGKVFSMAAAIFPDESEEMIESLLIGGNYTSIDSVTSKLHEYKGGIFTAKDNGLPTTSRVTSIFYAFGLELHFIEINEPDNNDEFALGVNIDFIANVISYASGLSDSARTSEIVWESDIDGEIGNGGNITVNTLAGGEHQITATYNTLQDNVTIYVDRPVVEITSPSDMSSFTAGDNISFSGTATDGEDGNIASSLSWASNLDGVFGTGASFSYDALSQGIHIITASVTDSSGLEASDSIQVTILRP